MTNRPPSPEAKTRSMSVLGRISHLLRRAALIAAVATVPLIAVPAPVAAGTDVNTAQCINASISDGQRLALGLGHCSNAFEGTIYLVYPDGTKTVYAPWGEFWQFSTGSPFMMNTVIPITQSGTYTLSLDGTGFDGALQPTNVRYRYTWNLTAPRGSTPTPSTPAPSTPKPDATPKPAVTPKPDATPAPVSTPDDTALVTETEPSVEPSAEPSMTTDDQVAAVTIDEARETVSTAASAVGAGLQSLVTTIVAVAAGVLALGTLLIVAVVRRRRS